MSSVEKQVEKRGRKKGKVNTEKKSLSRFYASSMVGQCKNGNKRYSWIRYVKDNPTNIKDLEVIDAWKTKNVSVISFLKVSSISKYNMNGGVGPYSRRLFEFCS